MSNEVVGVAVVTAPTPRDRFLIALAKFLGVTATETDPLNNNLLTDRWHFDECLALIITGGDAVQLTFERFNQLMLHVRRRVVSRGFFDHFLTGVTDVSSFENAVEHFRIEALWHFGNFRFAYGRMTICSKQELSDLLERPKLSPSPAERDPFTEIQPIPVDNLWVLGYVSKDLVLALGMGTTLIEHLIAGEAPPTVWSSVPADSRRLLPKAFARAKVKLTFDDSGIGQLEPADLLLVKVALVAEHDALKATTEASRKIGLENTKRYLTLPCLDVYVATSMREDDDFRQQAKFTEQVFGDPSVVDLRLRFFDPTLSFVDDRITKGLIENLMLRRAKVTIYNAGAADSLGKDSELAATLAQGKPVIAYVPEGDANLDRRAKLFRADHPLGLQIDVSTGVAHGILVVRTPAQCAKMLRALLTHTLDLQVNHEGGNYQLVEKETGSVLRVASDDPLLTHSFWTFFNQDSYDGPH